MRIILMGTHANGRRQYYTGKAGQAFVSDHHEDAFDFGSLESARVKGKRLNSCNGVHGIRFCAVKID